MPRVILFLCLILSCCNSHSQYKESHKKLASELNEISGLARWGDSLLIAINDSGNSSKIYFLSMKGKIVHECKITNAQNIDWEDLTTDDKGNVYIADCGNNLNDRKDLEVLKVNCEKAYRFDTISAQALHFSYENQTQFPPNKKEREFNCESIFWKKDSLYLITKSARKPWKGNANIYVLATNKIDQKAKLRQELFIGNKGNNLDAVTSADYRNNLLYVLTYNRYIVLEEKDGMFVKKHAHKFNKYDQKESILILTPEEIMVASERHKVFGGPFLYTITKK